MNRRGVSAFTLQEMMVVLAILTTLLAMLLPSIQGAMESARRVVCACNEKAWGTSLMAYGADQRMSYPYNGQSLAPLVPIGGHNVSWNSSTVQQFWEKYLSTPASVAGEDRTSLLNCPTRKWHKLSEVDPALSQLLGGGDGLSGYFYLPHRYAYSVDYTPAGQSWVTRSRLGGANTSRLPVMMDVKQSDGTGSWLAGGLPVSSHADYSGTPSGGNYLFEDAGVHWYESEKIELGATMLTWNFWYKIPSQ